MKESHGKTDFIGLKFCTCATVLFSLLVFPVDAALIKKSTGSVAKVSGGGFVGQQMIRKLMTEKKQKMEQLEQCAKKVKGFKIAGISTLGLTAVGVGGNIALAVKKKDLTKKIDSTKKQIEEEEKKLQNIKDEIRSKSKKEPITQDDCEKINGAEWKETDCVCIDENQTIKSGACIDKTNNQTSSDEEVYDRDAYKVDCLAHPEIAKWVKNDDDGWEWCKCIDESLTFEQGKCHTSNELKSWCTASGGFWNDDDVCYCDYISNSDEKIGKDAPSSDYKCVMNQDFIKKYNLKKRSSDGLYYPPEYVDGKCITIKGEPGFSDVTLCPGGKFPYYKTMGHLHYDMMDKYFDFIPDGACFSLDEYICNIDGKIVEKACVAAGGHLDEYRACICPEANKVFWHGKCVNKNEAEKGCVSSGGKFNYDEEDNQMTCDCKYGLGDANSSGCTTEDGAWNYWNN